MRGLWRVRPGVEIEVDILGHDKPWGVHRLLVRLYGGLPGNREQWVNADHVRIERVTPEGLVYVPWDAREQEYK